MNKKNKEEIKSLPAQVESAEKTFSINKLGVAVYAPGKHPRDLRKQAEAKNK
jgi:hypothetical protein